MDIIGYELVESFLYGKVVFGLLGLSAILLIIANFLFIKTNSMKSCILLLVAVVPIALVFLSPLAISKEDLVVYYNITDIHALKTRELLISEIKSGNIQYCENANKTVSCNKSLYMLSPDEEKVIYRQLKNSLE